MPTVPSCPAALRGAARLIAVLLALVAAAPATALETGLFRIGTGGEKGTYFPIGTLIADALSARNDGCEDGADACGVAGLLAVAQLSNGSVSNAEAIATGTIEAGLVQADVADGAFFGRGVFTGKGRHPQLRAIANLYSETVHIVVATDAGIRSVAELRGRRVSLDELGSGTLVDARLVLDAYGLSEADLRPFYVKPQFAAERMVRGELDAFFIVAGHPTPSVAEATAGGRATLLPIDSQHGAILASRYPFLHVTEIPAETYPGVGATPTLAVGAQLVVNADLDEELVYRITAALWSARTRRMLASGHPRDAISCSTTPCVASASRCMPVPPVSTASAAWSPSVS